MKMTVLLAGAVIAVAALRPPSPASAATSPRPVTAVLDSEVDHLTPAAKLSTLYATDVDLPHVSGRDVSVHGWWVKFGGSARLAKVTVCLQRMGASGTYVNFKCNSGTVRPGGGRGKRVTVRHTCSGKQGPYLWRGVAEVNIIGEADPYQLTVRDPIGIPCSP
jgi:hypothetical protein